MSVTIQVRRDLSANWTSVNPVLNQGEIGLETDTGKAKIGDGVTHWASLAYWNPGGDFTNPMTLLGDLISGGASGAAARLAGNTTATKEFLTSTGTGSAANAPAWGALASGDIPNNAANTSGTAGGLSATLAVGSGGTGQTSAAAAYNALSPMTTLGDIEYESGANTAARLAGNTTAVQKLLAQTGTGSASAAPVWMYPAAVTAPPPSGDTTGATDQAAITAIETGLSGLGGGVILFQPGTYWVTGLIKQSGTIWQGAGRVTTGFKLASGADTDVIQGAGFAALTLSGSFAGIGDWGLRDLSIDGNKAGQSGTSYGLRVYGYQFTLEHVSIANCLTDGLYTEWGSYGGSATPDRNMSATIIDLVIRDSGGNGWHNRGPHDSYAEAVQIFWTAGGGTFAGYWSENPAAATVAAGSNGVNTSTFTGAGVLNVSTTLGYPAASINSTQGSLTVATGGTPAVITYTGVTATSFTGCTTVSGGGVLATGGSVAMTGGGYAASLQVLNHCHVYNGPAYSYVFDASVLWDNCVAEQAGTGAVLIRASGTQLLGGACAIYAGSQTGYGIQVGDTANGPFSVMVDTCILGFAGTGASTAPLNVVNDGQGNWIKAMIKTAGTLGYAGTPAVNSYYDVTVFGQASEGANAALGLRQSGAVQTLQVPGSTNRAFAIRAGSGATDLINFNTSGVVVEAPNGYLWRWWKDSYATATATINAATGAIQPGTTAGAGGHLYSGSGAPNITGSAAGDVYIRTDNGTRSYYIATGANTWSTLQPADLPAGTTSAQGALQLDGTAADIQALAASASAGSSGLAADARHAHPNTGVLPTAGGVMTGNLELAAGTTSLAPLAFQSGANLTTATAGDAEFDGTALYFTAAASSRQVVTAEQIQVLSSNYTLANNTSAQALLNATAAGALTVQGATTYLFECVILGTGFSGSSHQFQFGIAGGASFTSLLWTASVTHGSTGTPAQAFSQTAAATTLDAATTATNLSVMMKGVLRVNVGGTIIPQLTQVTASAAGVLQPGTYFRCWPVGSNTVTNVGDWS